MTDTSFIARTVEEDEELLERVAKLRRFINSDAFDTAPDEEKKMLRDQLYHMEEYSRCLHRRITYYTRHWGA